MPPTLLDPHELAEELDSSYPNVLDWARRGVIPSIKVKGRYYFNLARVVEALRRPAPEPEREAAAC